MGFIKLKLIDKIENSFRKAAMQRFGYQKGSISKAAQEALENWTTQYEKIDDKIEDPVEAISGLMKNIKKNSVELQHEAWKSIGEKHAH